MPLSEKDPFVMPVACSPLKSGVYRLVYRPLRLWIGMLMLLGVFSATTTSPGAWAQADVLNVAPATSYAVPATEDSTAMSAIKINTASEKVPAGTMLTITFQTAMDSRITVSGEPFTAFLEDDLLSASPQNGGTAPHVILPRHTMLRGRIAKVQRPRLFSRGGSIQLVFDHVVLPSGDLLPLDLNLSAKNRYVKRLNTPKAAPGTVPNATKTQQFVLYSDPGVKHKLHQSVSNGVQTLGRFKDAGIESGRDVAGGAGMLVTVPAAVVGGAIAGTAVTTGKSAQALIGRGESMVIRPGDKVNIDFGGAFTLPSE